MTMRPAGSPPIDMSKKTRDVNVLSGGTSSDLRKNSHRSCALALTSCATTQRFPPTVSISHRLSSVFSVPISGSLMIGS